MKKSSFWLRAISILIICLLLCSCAPSVSQTENATNDNTQQQQQVSPAPSTNESTEIPKYSGASYIAISGNQPRFTENELNPVGYEFYSELDTLGRCGYVFAVVGTETMPTEERGSIGMVKPTGWQTAKYDIVDGKYLYNRCHLIGFQLTGENANEKNLITGTRYLNIEGMLPFENMVADYVKETKNHVAYRVTPIFEGDNLVASGVIMEGYSIEDGGDGICFNVYCYNVQPGVDINYKDGTSALGEINDSANEKEQVSDSSDNLQTDSKSEYVLNTGTKKFHEKSCSSVSKISDKNKDYATNRAEIINQGYDPCGICKP